MNKRKAAGRPPFASRGAIIKVHRVSKGKTLKWLSTQAKLSYRTVAKAEHGQSVSDDALAGIAIALALDYELLKYDPRSHPPPTTFEPTVGKPAAFPAITVVDPPFEVLTQKQALGEFIRTLADTMRAANALLWLSSRGGSTIMTFQMSFWDTHRLCEAFVYGELSALAITDITIKPRNRFAKFEMDSIPENQPGYTTFLPQDEAFF